jgi:malate dehydrogenase
MSKITVIGAGNVGATCANVLVCKQVADEVVLLDIKPGVSEGKAMDIMQTANILGINTILTGTTNDYSKTKDSDVVVITSGIPRKPGMTREELIGVNAKIVKSVIAEVVKASPNAVVICISNPMDTMTYLIHKTSGLPKNRIIGMGGALDSARFKFNLRLALNANAGEVDGFVIGGHNDKTMIPMTRYAVWRGVPVTNFLSKEQLDKIAADTKVGGATLTGLLGTSAWYAPGAAAAQVCEAVLHDEKKLIPCSALVEGEYGFSDLCIGVPCILGKGGIEKIVEIELNDEEKALFAASAAAAKKTNEALADALK